ncbi:BNR-4 repeat-containing protein [Thermostilla marina]
MHQFNSHDRGTRLFLLLAGSLLAGFLAVPCLGQSSAKPPVEQEPPVAENSRGVPAAQDSPPTEPPEIPLWQRVDNSPLPAVATEKPFPLPYAEGFQGIWYPNQPSGDEYVYKYSGGLGTYPQQLNPIAIYAPEVRKTFFVFGGRASDANRLLHMISYYDHETGLVARPRILLDKQTDDAHDNPTLVIDGEGYVWIFSNAHGTSRPAFVHRSEKPYAIDSFIRIAETNFSYSQPWFVPQKGFCFLHTHYEQGRRFLFVWRSDDGFTWSNRRLLAAMAQGQYQISWPAPWGVGTAFNVHPRQGGLNARTNLYYLETRDGGDTWQTADGTPIDLPLLEPDNAALVHDYASEGRLVYLKDINYDAEGRPVILYLTSNGYRSGPESGPRVWHTAAFDGTRWVIRDVTTSDHNYDYGPLYIEPDGTWRLIAPTDTGPQAYNPGGEVVMWTSRDRGRHWEKVRRLTAQSVFNHTYIRRPLGAQPDFYALWADGHARRESESRLYFTNRSGDTVFMLPPVTTGEFSRPIPVWRGEEVAPRPRSDSEPSTAEVTVTR